MDGLTSSPMSSMGSIVELLASQLEHLTMDSTFPQNKRKGYSSPDFPVDSVDDDASASRSEKLSGIHSSFQHGKYGMHSASQSDLLCIESDRK